MITSHRWLVNRMILYMLIPNFCIPCSIATMHMSYFNNESLWEYVQLEICWVFLRDTDAKLLTPKWSHPLAVWVDNCIAYFVHVARLQALISKYPMTTTTVGWLNILGQLAVATIGSLPTIYFWSNVPCHLLLGTRRWWDLFS